MTSEQIARAMAIPDRHVLMVLKQLISAGLVCSYSCIARGYELSRELEEISLWDIYNDHGGDHVGEPVPG